MTGAFERLLKNAMGLDVISIGSRRIERAVKERQAACGLPDEQSYFEAVSESQSELQELIETVVVPETWFFRDAGAFSALQLLVNERGGRVEKMRILSVPCSSGEEPYSIAMALFDAGLREEQIRVDAVDISAQAIERAARAMYGKNAFRGGDLAFRGRHFTVAGEYYRVNDAVRRMVCFEQGNLLATEFLPGVEMYDAIFCRNLLIYFDRATQDSAMKVLQRLLKPAGVLFVGPSETGLLLFNGFRPIAASSSFGFNRVEAKKVEPTRKVPHTNRHHVVPAVVVPHLPIRKALLAPISDRSPAAAKPSDDLQEASALADRGRFTEAAQICERNLRERGPTSPAFHIMGLIRSAAGDLNAATTYFRKALYLNPDCYEALIHLTFLLEKQGDTAETKALRNRMRRLRSKEAS